VWIGVLFDWCFGECFECLFKLIDLFCCFWIDCVVDVGDIEICFMVGGVFCVVSLEWWFGEG